MEAEIQPIILCGGSGTRLWPLSRDHFPKQLLPLMDEHSLLQNTLLRLSGLDCSNPILVSNESHRFLVAEQLRQINYEKAEILLEPVGRNSAPAVAVAALRAVASGADPVLLVLPSDHVIENEFAFHQAVTRAVGFALQGDLVTFGVMPTAPETGYGYIRRGAEIGVGAFKVSNFFEKPLRPQAEQYLASGDYYWNSGMFVFKASSYLREMALYEPEILEACQQAVKEAITDIDFVRLGESAFSECKSKSIDYAVMERTARAVIVPLDSGWSDIGSFSSLWEKKEHDEDGNVICGDVIVEESRNSYINASERLVAVLGLDSVVVVETADAVLVGNRHSMQDVKKIVDVLKGKGREESHTHRRVYRPWGYYESMDRGDRFQVKRIGVNPGASLSLQMHYHRAEHWVVVSGTAEVTCEGRVYLVAENESTFIPLGHKHRLHNPGNFLLEIIEIQSGHYLGEDDIVRFDDIYGRA